MTSLIGSALAFTWVMTGAGTTLTLIRFRPSVILKYSAPIHAFFAVLVPLFLSWQTVAFCLALQLSFTFTATHLFAYFNQIPLKIDALALLPHLKNQLETIEEGEPYNFLFGEFYPQESCPLLPAFAHTVDLVWRYVSKQDRPSSYAAKEALEKQLQEIKNRLTPFAKNALCDKPVENEERELIYWQTYIAPLRGDYAIESPSLRALALRVLLGEPIPVDALKEISKMVVCQADYSNPKQPIFPHVDRGYEYLRKRDPKFPNLILWAQAYNRELSLDVVHLHFAFEDIFGDSQMARRVIFFLMRDYGLKPDKNSDGRLPRDGLAYEIQQHYAFPKDLEEKRNEPLPEERKTLLPERSLGNFTADAYDPQIYDHLGWSKQFATLRERRLMPKFSWKDFVIVNDVPDLGNPFITIEPIHYSSDTPQRDIDHAWNTQFIDFLLEGIDPLDPSPLTRWRLSLLHTFGICLKYRCENYDAFRNLCHESQSPEFLHFAYDETILSSQIGSAGIILGHWREDIKALVDTVQREYNLKTPQEAMVLVASALEKEWGKETSPLRALAYINTWPKSWLLKFVHQFKSP